MNYTIQHAKDALDLIICGAFHRLEQGHTDDQHEQKMKELFAALKEEISDWECIDEEEAD